MGTKLDGLSYELQRELRDLEEAFKNCPQPTIQSLLKLKGGEAQYKLDLLQLLVDLTDEKHTRSITRKVLFRLSKSSGRVPQCLVIRNIKRVGDPFGGGGFGDIWRGEIGDSPGDSIECAVKVGRWYRNVDGEDEYEDAVKTHLREAILWGQLKHPNLLPFLGMYYLDGSKRDVCLVSPYLASGNLTRYLKRTPPEEIDSHGLVGSLPSGSSCHTHHPHSGVRHCDRD
ncbi:hypothetical protein AAF712_002965 [Marasmius tenuissimus]|uniref:Protein kinase domain-containing protein n=1 Tax=Marasmius tenuissimus TaxID=585030 RepID=A0ABR3AAP0_9AGAR